MGSLSIFGVSFMKSHVGVVGRQGACATRVMHCTYNYIAMGKDYILLSNTNNCMNLRSVMLVPVLFPCLCEGI